MMKKRLLMLLVLVAAVLVCTSAMIEAQADDTYNFYFQKAPGPTTVNQGVAAQPSVQVKADPAGNAAVVPTPAAPATVAQAAAPEEPSRGVRALELSLGVAGSRHSGSGDNTSYYRPDSQQSGMINAAHYNAGLQWNVTPYFAVQGEAFYLTKNPVKNTTKGEIQAQGSRLDYAANLIVTPFRLGTPDGAVRINGSLLLGAMTVPFLRGDSGHRHYFDSDTTPPQIGHGGSFTYGARLGLDFGRVALNTTIRRIDRYSSTQGTAALAIAL